MGNPDKSPPRIGFGEFELDLRTRELFNGRKLDLPEQPFLVLYALLEKPGELVTREELTNRLWPADTFVDFEHSLNRVINRLREALEDSAEKPRFIETLPRRGYRFVASAGPVRTREDPGHERIPSRDEATAQSVATSQTASSATDQEPQPEKSGGFIHEGDDRRKVPLWTQRVVFAVVTIGLGCLAGWLTFWLLSPAPTLRVVAQHQLTKYARIDTWAPLVSDGSRIFFLEREGDHWNLRETSVNGGEPQTVAAPFRNTIMLDVSPDHASFLIGSFVKRLTLMPLWIWPVQGGAPKRLGDVEAYSAIWSRDGRSVVYSMDDGIYQVEADGTNAHRLVAIEGAHGERFSWSPDGGVLRFSRFGTKGPGKIWQMNSDGSNLHALHPDFVCCGRWSPDGEYFILTSSDEETNDIAVILEKTNFLGKRTSDPMQITRGPLRFLDPLPSVDGRRVFVLGIGGKGELARYDLVQRQFAPWLPGVSALSLAVSPNGEWLAYEDPSSGALMRVKVDGSQPLTLTPQGFHGGCPKWSPDGKFIAVTLLRPSGNYGLFLISADGGTPVEIEPDEHNQGWASWSPDGTFLAFARQQSPDPARGGVSIRLFNTRTKEDSLLPGSPGVDTPTWSPDGHFISALTEDRTGLMLFDIEKQTWLELAKAIFMNDHPTWSKDGTFLYFQDLLTENQPIYRIRMSDRKKELVTTFEGYLHSGIARGSLEGLAPDGSLIARLDRGGADIYSLDLELH